MRLFHYPAAPIEGAPDPNLLAVVELPRSHYAAVLSKELPRAVRLTVQLKAAVPDAAVVVIRDVRSGLGCFRHAGIIALGVGRQYFEAGSGRFWVQGDDGDWLEPISIPMPSRDCVPSRIGAVTPSSAHRGASQRLPAPDAK